MKNFLKKLKKQKGATGIDVLISASMIVLTIGIVSMLYLNTSIQSRNITRTSGASRIATNLIENIEAMDYDDFVKAFSGASFLESGTTTENTFFGTKIPKGYRAKVETKPVYGTHSATSEQFDLVRQVKVLIEYSVGNKNENIEFSTVKKRDLLEECNKPATGDLRNTILGENINFYPVKFIQNANAYVKTREDDSDWYSYSNRNWATVIVSKLSESALFDVNGKLVKPINTNKSNAQYVQKAIWIPRYYSSKDTTNKNVLFAFNASQSKAIVSSRLRAKDNASEFHCNLVANMDTSKWINTNTLRDFGAEGTVTGKWVLIPADASGKESLPTDSAVTILNTSQYGPYNMH